MASRDSGALTCDPDRMNLQRMCARGVVILGGLFWAIAAFSGQYVFNGIDLTGAVGSALVPLALTAVVYALGCYSDTAAAMLLIGLSGSGVVWGAVAGWDPGVWALMLTFFVAPMLVAGTFYALARRMEAACGGAARALRLLDAPDPSITR